MIKSATSSRAWLLPGVFLLPPALLVVADLYKNFYLKRFFYLKLAAV
jgi:hypothetical protein